MSLLKEFPIVERLKAQFRAEFFNITNTPNFWLGGDVTYLRRRKISATGWDPFHLPDSPIVAADIVNLGFVLNVIEDPNERSETLRVAFSLARKLLVVSVRVEHGLDSTTEFNDGIITSKGTFQKIYAQAEFKEYVEAVLARKVHVAGIGVVYVFSDSDAESEFLASQAFSRRLAYRTELIEEFAKDSAGKKFIQLANSLGRVPLPSEFKAYRKLIDRFGSPHRIERLALAKINPSAFEGSKAQRREDLLTYMAMIRLQGLKVPPMRSLPSAIQADLKSLWRDYHSALSEAESFLFSIGQPEVVKDVFAKVKHGNLWRMKQLYEAYAGYQKLAPLVRVLSWSHNLLILGHSKSPEEREFYLRWAVKSKWSKRELARQIKTAAFERTILSDKKLAPPVRVLLQDATGVFKDSYLLDFLDLPERHSEADLQTGLLRNLRAFLMELGDGFAFVGEKVRVQVGNQDFELDLLFYHRDLQCLVAFELKTGRFEPEHMGKLSFYLEALDRDRKRPHENPSIGVLLCRTKDDEVVEYAMSRHLSPALVAHYETQMIPKAVLQQKLHEWSLMLEAPEAPGGDET